MPRSPQIVARQKLEQAVVFDERADIARKRAKESLYQAMVKAVESGISRGEVAKIVGVSRARVAQIPNMPAGPNVHKDK